MRKLLNMFKRTDNAYSVGRICAVLAFVAFLCVSLYLVLLGKEWRHYDTFVYVCAGYIVTQLANKTVEVWGFKVKGGDNNA